MIGLWDIIKFYGQPLLIAASLLLGGWFGYQISHAELVRLQRDVAILGQKNTDAALRRYVQAAQRADLLEGRLATSEAARLTQAEEHTREIKRLTTGRPCLNAGTVRLLNSSTGIWPVSLPETASRPAAEDAAAATDTDVAEWIDHAIRQYDTCRDRLGALIDYEQGDQE
jgi:hypothetical protein